MIQFAMGIAFWILPRFSRGAPRGNEHLGWLVLMLINAGILFVVLDIPFKLKGLTFTGRILELLGLAMFLVGHWKRIKGFDTL